MTFRNRAMDDMTRQETLIGAAGRAAERFATDETGATAIEYALIAGGVAVAIAATVWNIGAQVLTQLYQKVANAMS